MSNQQKILYIKQQDKMTEVKVTHRRNKLHLGLIGEWPFIPRIPVPVNDKDSTNI